MNKKLTDEYAVMQVLANERKKIVPFNVHDTILGGEIEPKRNGERVGKLTTAVPPPAISDILNGKVHAFVVIIDKEDFQEVKARGEHIVITKEEYEVLKGGKVV